MNIYSKRLNTLRNDSDWDNEVVNSINSIAKDIVNADCDIYIRNDGQGKGKSTATLVIMVEGDTFASNRHNLLEEKKELMEQLGVDSIHVVGLRTAIQEEVDASEMPDNILQARKTSPVDQMREDYEEYNKEYVKHHYDNDITQEISSQWKQIENGDKAVFCSVKMIPVIESIQGDEKGHLFLDEGVERDTDAEKRPLQYQKLLKPFYGNKALNLDNFSDKFGQIEEENIEKFKEAWNNWEKFVDWVVQAESNVYKFSDQTGAERIVEIKVDEYGDWTALTKAYSHFQDLMKKHPKYDYKKSLWEIELYHQIEQGNDHMVRWMKQVELSMEFLTHFYESSGRNLLRVEGDDATLIQSRKLVADDLVDWTDKQVTVLDAESSEWMENWNNRLDIEREGERDDFDFPIYNIQPRKNKNTLTKKHVTDEADFVEEICETINRLHKKSEIKVGAVGYKEFEKMGMIDAPFLYYGNSEGMNDLKDVDILFILGSPRVAGEEMVKWYHDLKDELPKLEFSNLVDLDDNKNQKGYIEPTLNMLYDGQVERKVRDAVGRGRTATLCFQIGQKTDYLNYEKERASRSEMFTQLGLEAGFDKLPVPHNKHEYGDKKNKVKLAYLLMDNEVEGSLDEIQDFLTSIGIEKRDSTVKQSLKRSKFYKGKAESFSLRW